MLEFRGFEGLEGRAEFLARGGEVLEQLHFVVEMDEEGFVFIFAEGAIEEGVAGGALFVEDAALAAAGVDQKTQGERQVTFASKILDGLRVRIFFEGEIGLIEIWNDFAVLIADGGIEGDELHFGGDFGW